MQKVLNFCGTVPFFLICFFVVMAGYIVLAARSDGRARRTVSVPPLT